MYNVCIIVIIIMHLASDWRVKGFHSIPTSQFRKLSKSIKKIGGKIEGLRLERLPELEYIVGVCSQSFEIDLKISMGYGQPGVSRGSIVLYCFFVTTCAFILSGNNVWIISWKSWELRLEIHNKSLCIVFCLRKKIIQQILSKVVQIIVWKMFVACSKLSKIF